MEIIVTDSDKRRRSAEVKEKTYEDPTLATVKNAQTGKTVEGYAVPTEGLEFQFVERKTGHFRAKADDFKALATEDLLKKYPNDQTIRDALLVQGLAGKYAERHFANKEDQEQFMETTNNRLSYNLEYGKPNRSPQIMAAQQQEQKPQELER